MSANARTLGALLRHAAPGADAPGATAGGASAPPANAPGAYIPRTGEAWVVALDTSIAGVHFPLETSPEDVAYKSIVVNLSDLAAMGASPHSLALAVTAPAADHDWVASFCRGFQHTLATFELGLDAVTYIPGPLSVSVQACGCVPAGNALLRSGARPGDAVIVSGTLGDASLGLDLQLRTHTDTDLSLIGKDARNFVLRRLNRPTPRLQLGESLRGLATSAIDLSDGLGQDITHILAASEVGARIAVHKLPVSPVLAECCTANDRWRRALFGGDDYELCFTVPASRWPVPAIETLATQLNLPLTCIGEITVQPGLRLELPDGSDLAHTSGMDGPGMDGPGMDGGYNHFS